MTKILPVKALHARIFEDLPQGENVGDNARKPLELRHPEFARNLKMYCFNLRESRGRSSDDEWKIQIRLPGRSAMDFAGTIPFLIGYSETLQCYVLWDAELYADAAYSRSIYTNLEAIRRAARDGLTTQKRTLRSPPSTEEVVLCTRPQLLDALKLRRRLTMLRASGGQ